MHSWWISHFGLWPGSHPITFKLAAACKTHHISHRALQPLWGPYAPTTTLINQLLVKKKKGLGHPSPLTTVIHTTLTPPTPHCMLTVHHTPNMQLGNWFHTCLCPSWNPPNKDVQYVWVCNASLREREMYLTAVTRQYIWGGFLLKV